MDFQKVSYDGDLDDMDAENLRTVVEEYEEAQTSNIAEFESAKDTIDGLEGEVAEKAEFKSRRVEKLTEVSPLGEDDVESFSLARIDSLIEEFTEDSAGEGDDPDADPEDPEFDDMGRRGPTHDNEEAAAEFAEQVGSIPGVVVNTE